MRTTAGDVVEEAGAYRCLCCGQRVFVGSRNMFERCTSCDGSLFEPDRRCSEYPFDEAGETAPVEVIDDSPGRQWSML